VSPLPLFFLNISKKLAAVLLFTDIEPTINRKEFLGPGFAICGDIILVQESYSRCGVILQVVKIKIMYRKSFHEMNNTQHKRNMNMNNALC